jgi:hypothetical protein
LPAEVKPILSGRLRASVPLCYNLRFHKDEHGL